MQARKSVWAKMTVGRISASAILERTFGVIAADRMWFAFCFLAITAVGIGIDHIGSEAGSVSLGLVSFGMTIIFQTGVTNRVLMMRDGATPNTMSRNRYIAVFGALFVSGLGILAGLVLLIIPGLFLFVRWYVLIPALLDSRNDQRSAYEVSYRLTGRAMGAVTLVALVFVVPLLLLLMPIIVEAFGITTGWLAWFIDGAFIDGESIGFSIILNAMLSLSGLGSWYAGAAMYLMLNDDHHDLSDVFS